MAMKKLLIASAALAFICAPAFAHTTGTATHHKSSMSSRMHSKGSAMKSGTTGMGHGTHNRAMRPDASGQGGSGPGSDQGGTRAAPGSMK